MTDLGPLYGLRLRTPRLELRLGSREELLELGRLAKRGVHPRAEMPFGVAWSDRIGQPEFLDDFRAFHEDHLSRWSPDEWTLNLLVWTHGTLVGTQGIDGARFGETRRVHTGSWLGREHQGSGIGTEMRAAVLELAFAGLGASIAASDWLDGNHASRRVSEKLGYVEVGLGSVIPRGDPIVQHKVEVARERWHCPMAVEIEGLDPCRPLFGL